MQVEQAQASVCTAISNAAIKSRDVRVIDRMG